MEARRGCPRSPANPSQTKNQKLKIKKLIKISDVGTFSTAELTEAGVKEINSGGCPVEEILNPMKLDVNDSNEDLEAAILARWSKGYDGDPAENELSVTVTDAE